MRFFLFSIILLFVSLGCRLKSQNSIYIRSNPPNFFQEDSTSKKILAYKLKKGRVKLIKPNKFTVFNQELPLYCYGSGMSIGFINKDSTILIGIGVYPRDSLAYERDIKVTAKLQPEIKNYDPNKSWLRTFNGTVDSSIVKPKFFSKKQLEAYNADSGVEYLKSCDQIFLNGYILERTVILNKKFRGIIEVSYFTKLKQKDNISNLINRINYKMVYFEK